MKTPTTNTQYFVVYFINFTHLNELEWKLLSCSMTAFFAIESDFRMAALERDIEMHSG